MKRRGASLLSAGLALFLSIVPILTAGERTYRGKWEGSAVEMRLNINDRTGAVSGVVYKPGSPDNIIASMTGKLLSDGSLEVKLTYRFENYGTFVLKPSQAGSLRSWETAGRDLWFGASD